MNDCTFDMRIDPSAYSKRTHFTASKARVSAAKAPFPTEACPSQDVIEICQLRSRRSATAAPGLRLSFPYGMMCSERPAFAAAPQTSPLEAQQLGRVMVDARRASNRDPLRDRSQLYRRRCLTAPADVAMLGRLRASSRPCLNCGGVCVGA